MNLHSIQTDESRQLIGYLNSRYALSWQFRWRDATLEYTNANARTDNFWSPLRAEEVASYRRDMIHNQRVREEPAF